MSEKNGEFLLRMKVINMQLNNEEIKITDRKVNRDVVRVQLNGEKVNEWN